MNCELNFLPQFDNPKYADIVLVVRETESKSSPGVDDDVVENIGKKGRIISRIKAFADGSRTFEENEETPCKRIKIPSPCPSDFLGSVSTTCYHTGDCHCMQCPGDAGSTTKSHNDSAEGPSILLDEDMAQEEEIIPVKKYHMHRFLLATHSKYFQSLFDTEVKGSKSKEIQVEIPNGKSIAFESLLKALYSKTTLENLSFQEIAEIIFLAHRFQCKPMLDHCLAILSEKNITTVDETNIVAKCIDICSKRASANILGTNLNEMLHNLFAPNLDSSLSKNGGLDKLNSLSHFSLASLIDAHHVNFIGEHHGSENSLLTCILTWAETHHPAMSILTTLVTSIHPENLTSNFLNDVITANHPVLSNIPFFKEWFYNALRYHSFPEARKQKHRKYKVIKADPASISHLYRFDLVSTQISCATDAGEQDKIYRMEGPMLLCEGYFIYTQVIMKDGNIRLKMSVPNLVGVDGKVYFHATMKMIWRIRGMKIFHKDFNLTFSRLANPEIEISFRDSVTAQYGNICDKKIKAELTVRLDQ